MGDKLHNPFASAGQQQQQSVTPTDDFIQFSSTPVEKRSWKDRKAPKPNLRNFNHNFNDSGSPHHNRGGGWNGGTPRGGRGGWRGGGGGTPYQRGGHTPGRGGSPHWGGTPHRGGFNPNFRGDRGGGSPASFVATPVGNSRGGRGGRGGGKVDRSQSWFHGSMLEDPWARLLNNRPRGSSSFDDGSHHHSCSRPAAEAAMSDSMIPQVGDSLLERQLADETTTEEETGTTMTADDDDGPQPDNNQSGES